MLFATGVALAVAQPGDLGDSDDDTAGPAETTTATTEPDETPGGETDRGTDGASTTAPAEQTTTTAVAGGDATTSTTQPTSGIGADGAGSVGDGIADTGHESMLAAGLVLLAAGLAARRAVHAT